MINKKPPLTRIPEYYYNPKYYRSDLRVILESLKGTKFNNLKIAKEIMQYRKNGLRWNLVEDAIDEAELRRCQPIIERLINEQKVNDDLIFKQKVKKHFEQLTLERRKKEFELYQRHLENKGNFRHHYDFLITGILKYLKDISPFYEELNIAIMTIDHFNVEIKEGDKTRLSEELWVNELRKITNDCNSDRKWLKKLDAIIRKLHPELSIDLNEKSTNKENTKNDPEIPTEEDSYSDFNNSLHDYNSPNFYDEFLEEYDDRGAINGLRYYCDLDDLDDGFREEF